MLIGAARLEHAAVLVEGGGADDRGKENHVVPQANHAASGATGGELARSRPNQPSSALVLQEWSRATTCLQQYVMQQVSVEWSCNSTTVCDATRVVHRHSETPPSKIGLTDTAYLYGLLLLRVTVLPLAPGGPGRSYFGTDLQGTLKLLIPSYP